jgi:hypothetical protein
MGSFVGGFAQAGGCCGWRGRHELLGLARRFGVSFASAIRWVAALR